MLRIWSDTDYKMEKDVVKNFLGAPFPITSEWDEEDTSEEVVAHRMNQLTPAAKNLTINYDMEKTWGTPGQNPSDPSGLTSLIKKLSA